MERKIVSPSEEITLENFIRRLSRELNLRKTTDIGPAFGTYKNLQRILSPDNPRKIDAYECDQLMRLAEKKTGRAFAETMKEWFPELEGCGSDEEIRKYVRERLLCTGKTEKPSAGERDGISRKLRFLEECMEYPSPIRKLKMAFHTGYRWLENEGKVNVLVSLAQKGVDIMVMANPEDVIQRMAREFRDPAHVLRYRGFNETLAQWHKYEQAFSAIRLRVAEYPILRQTILVTYEDGTKRAYLRGYAYGTPANKIPSRIIVSQSDPFLKYFSDEFEYLWEKSKAYEEWSRTLREPKEFMKPCDYMLVYPAHEPSEEGQEQRWIYSLLSIGEKNKATLIVNLDPKAGTADLTDKGEFVYEGRLTLSRHNISIRLHDRENVEQVNLSFYRPIYDYGRFLGILSALSPSGMPVAFKCACFDRAQFLNIEYNLLYTLLCHERREGNLRLLSLDDADINQFYSDWMFRTERKEEQEDW